MSDSARLPMTNKCPDDSHDWVVTSRVVTHDTTACQIFENGDLVVVNTGRLIEEEILDTSDQKVVCRDCNTPFPIGERFIEFQ